MRWTKSSVENNVVNEIIWKRQTVHSDIGQDPEHLGRLHDTIFFYAKAERYTWNQQYVRMTPSTLQHVTTNRLSKGQEDGTKLADLTAPARRTQRLILEYESFSASTRLWRYTRETHAATVMSRRPHCSDCNGHSAVDTSDIVDEMTRRAGAERLG